MNIRTLATLHALALLAALAGCGGDAPDATSAASPPTPSGLPGAPAAPGTPGTRATCNLANFTQEAMDLVNQHRAAGASCGDRGQFPPVAALTWDAALTQASLVHSDDMMANNFFSHTGSNGGSAGDRATAAGYTWQTWGENIAAGQPTVASVVQAWMNSPGHCVNVMNASMRDIGLACVSGGAANTYRTYWTMTLGAQR